MPNRFLNFFSDPEDNNPAFVRTVRNILVFAMVANISILVFISGILPGTKTNVIQIITMTVPFILEVIAFTRVRHGKVTMAKYVVPVILLIAITYISVDGSGMHGIAMMGYPTIVVISALLLGNKSRYTMAPITIAAILIVAAADMTGFNDSSYAVNTGYDDALIAIALTLASSEILQLLINRLNENVRKAQENEKAQIVANQELRKLQVNLEDRVTSRTSELELANQRNEKRAKQFEAIAQVARATTTNESLETLLPRLTSLISEQFGFYHAGIFLLDENREFAVLRAANSEGGKRMLEHGHKLPVGQTGIVGFVSATGNPRIALDVGADAVFFNNPELPDTRSELALPLRIAGEIIGVLDVQSIVSNVFQEEDTDVLSTLADQVAVAIQNARSFETTQELLKEAQKYSREFLRESWRVLRAEQDQVGYMISKNNLKPLSKPMTSAQIRKATADKKTVIESGKTATLAVPIRLRNEVIGVMDIRVPDEHIWDDDEVDIVEAVAERLSLALETSMLLQTTRRRAEIERLTADISGRISATTQFDSILRTAAEELSRVLGGSDVLVQIQPDALETHVETEQAQVKE